MRVKLIILAVLIASVATVLLSPWQRSDERALVEHVARLNGQWVGRPAPPFTLPDLQGQTHSLEDHRGKVIFLNFWAGFCAPCREEMPSMERLVRQYQDRGLVMIAISFDPDAQDSQRFMDEFLPGQRSVMQVLHDPQALIGQQYGTELIPETYIIDRQGQIIARFVNAYDWTRPEVKSLIEALLSQTAEGSMLSKPLL